MRSADGTTFTSITMTGVNAVSYTDDGLTAGTTYYYRVAAVNNDGISDFSATASTATP